MRYLGRRFVPQLLRYPYVHLDALVDEAVQCLEGLAGAAREPRVVIALLVDAVLEQPVARGLHRLDEAQLGNRVLGHLGMIKN